MINIVIVVPDRERSALVRGFAFTEYFPKRGIGLLGDGTRIRFISPHYHLSRVVGFEINGVIDMTYRIDTLDYLRLMEFLHERLNRQKDRRKDD